MNEFIYQYISTDLFILIPVLFFIRSLLKKSNIKQYKLQYILTAISVILTNIYTIANTQINNLKEFLSAIFSGFCQGILISGASIFLKQIKKPTIKFNKKGAIS